MDECNSLEIDKTNLNEQKEIRINKISEIEKYQEKNIKRLIKENYTVKKLSRYVAAFDYIGKVLTVLGATSGGISIVSFTSVVGASVGITSASFNSVFSLTTGIIKKLLSITRNKKKKHDKILMLAKSKLNSIETLISQTLVDMEICHEGERQIRKVERKFEECK